MTKLNPVIYNKLLLQAQEAEYQGMPKLASDIMAAIGNEPYNGKDSYSYAELADDVKSDLWKISVKIMRYYGTEIDTVDANKLYETILSLADVAINDFEIAVRAENIIKSPNEPVVPGENK